MHKITIDGLDWTSKDEVCINGTVYVKKVYPTIKPTTINCKIIGIKPAYSENGIETLSLVLESDVKPLKMPYNSKSLRPGDFITIIKGDIHDNS